MARIFESWEGLVDADVIAEARGICRALENGLRRRDGATEDEILVMIETFVRRFNELENAHVFITSDEARDIRGWFEEIAARYELPVVSLDDLDGVEPRW